MTSKPPLFRNPIQGFRDTPITTAMMAILVIYTLWLGDVLIVWAQHLPPARLVGFKGPLAIMSLQAWGWWFIASACLGFVRLFVCPERKLSLILHLVKMSTLIAWAVAFDLGPTSTAQPSYSFVALVSFGSSFIVDIIQRRYGRARPALR